VPTVVFVHAHPDDEALLTSGTMARLSERGYRVVLVMATDGAAGLTSHEISHDHNLAQVRASELTESCRVLGVSGFHQLGYADSGLDGQADVPAGATRFADVDPGVVADRLVALFEEEEADVVVGYDSAGGYGHPDHVQVHKAVQRASTRFPRAALLEATLPREPMLRVVRIIRSQRWAVPALGGLDLQTWQHAFTPRSEITYRVDVRPFIAAKRASLQAHASQAAADDGPRTLSALLKLPKPVFRRVLGREWYRQVTSGDPVRAGLLADAFGPKYSPRRRRADRQ